MLKKRIQKANDRLNLLAALKTLQSELKELGPIPNNVVSKEIYNPWNGCCATCNVPKDSSLYDYGVRFFNIVAKFQDTNLLKSDLLADNESVKALIKHVNQSGRHEYGWVRSKPGEQVTADNVYLGDVFGIWTFTIRNFKEKTGDDWLQWAIQIYQLQNFLKYHVEPMNQLVNSILAKEQIAKYGMVDNLITKIATRGKRR